MSLFVWITGTAAFALATVSGWFSIYGIATTFAGQFNAMVAMGVALEYAKLVATSFLYRYNSIAPIAIKSAMYPLVIILVAVSMAGHFGFILNGYQSTAVALKGSEATIQLLIQEKQELVDRKKAIDIQIAQLPSDRVASRTKLMKAFDGEVSRLNTRIPEITAELQKLSSEKITQETHIGPIIYIAKALSVSVDQAALWFAIMIVVAFDPLTILLVLAVNIILLNEKNGNGLPTLKRVESFVPIVQPPPTNTAPEPIQTTQDNWIDSLVNTPSLCTPEEADKLQEIINTIDADKNPSPTLLLTRAKCKKILRHNIR